MGRQTVTEAAVRDIVGLGAAKLLERGLDATGGGTPEMVQAGLADFLNFYGENICVHSRPYAGVAQARDQLEPLGCRLAICPTKTEGMSAALTSPPGGGGPF